MTAGWESLGDWLSDQARELGHLVKPRPRPVGVPSLEDMPDPERRPGCERHLLCLDQLPCGADADWRIRVHGVDDYTGHHGSTPVLLCDQHLAKYEADWAPLLRAHIYYCAPCGRRFRRIKDVIEDRHRL